MFVAERSQINCHNYEKKVKVIYCSMHLQVPQSVFVSESESESESKSESEFRESEKRECQAANKFI